MTKRKFVCAVLSFLLLISTVPLSANAMHPGPPLQNTIHNSPPPTRAIGSFHMTIASNSKSQASGGFQLAAGETVTIKASYIPFDASIDYGLVDSNGIYYYINATNGTMDGSIQINQNGHYTLQIRNNSHYDVEVSGFVNY